MRVLYYSFVIIIIDQFSKLFIKGFSIPFLGIDVKGMRYGQSIDVIGNFFQITFVENPGMAFGIDVSTASKLLLSLFSIVASIGILIYLYKNRDKSFVERLALSFIFAGAVGNLIDRVFYGVFYGYAPIFYGKVVDFFNVDFFDFSLFGRTYERWPIFNVADAAVTVGVILILIFHRSVATKNEEPDVSINADGQVSIAGENDFKEISGNDNGLTEPVMEDENGTNNRKENSI